MKLRYFTLCKTVENLISILQSESEIVINWCKDNHIIVHPSKIQAIIFDKCKGNHTNQIINIGQKKIKAVSNVKFLGIEIDNKLNFNHHIKNIFKSP